MDPLIREWSKFFDYCLHCRIHPDVFDEYTVQLHKKSPLSGAKLATLLLKPREPAAASVDPKVVVYCERLLVLEKVNAADVLAATFQYSKDRPPKAEEDHNASKDDPTQWQNPPELEEIIFDRLHKWFASGERPVTGTERLGAVSIVSKWMTSMITSHTNDSMIQAIAGGVQQPPQSSMFVREGLGMLVVDMLENQKTLELLNRDQAKGRFIYCIYWQCVAAIAHVIDRYSKSLRPILVLIHSFLVPDVTAGGQSLGSVSEGT